MWTQLLVAAFLTASPLQPIQFAAPARGPVVYRLEGYLDHAPEGAVVYFKTIIGFGSQERVYLITKYARQGDGNAFLMFRNLGMFRPDFILIGPKAPIESLMNATAGSRVTGTFYYRQGMHVLELDPHQLRIE